MWLKVRGLLQLFHDVEHTDRDNTFYEKFNIRHRAGEILRMSSAFWTLPCVATIRIGECFTLNGHGSQKTCRCCTDKAIAPVTCTCCAAVYLWDIPAHREVWRALAAEAGGKGLYLAFADVICNDSQYLLDDVIRSLPEVCVLGSKRSVSVPNTAYWSSTAGPLLGCMPQACCWTTIGQCFTTLGPRRDVG